MMMMMMMILRKELPVYTRLLLGQRDLPAFFYLSLKKAKVLHMRIIFLKNDNGWKPEETDVRKRKRESL